MKTVQFVIVLALSGIVAAEYHTARPAGDFVNSIGVCAHWGYPDTPYGSRYEAVRDSLAAAGIRHVRDGLHQDRPLDLARYGVASTIVADPPNNVDSDISYITDLLSRIRTLRSQGALIDAIEGPNEPDLFWPMFGKTYKGQGFPDGAVSFQRDLYASVRADTSLDDVVVIGPSLGKTYDPGGGSPNPFADGQLSGSVDWGNFHPYPGGNPFSYPSPYGTIEKYYWHGSQPSGNLDEWPYAFNVYAPPFEPKPMAATETGYSTFTNGVSETVHAKYMPRLYLEYFRLGVQRAYSYEFVDEWGSQPDNREANFGLLRNDLSAKPAYWAIRNLIGLLDDPGAPFQPDSLDYILTVTAPPDQPQYDRISYVHSVLLQKRTGVFYLALWHEIANTDNSVTPPRQIEQPAMPATLVFGTAISEVKTHAIGSDGLMISTIVVRENNVVRVAVPDHVIVLEIGTPSAITAQQRHSGTTRLANSRNASTEFTRVFDLKGRIVRTDKRAEGVLVILAPETTEAVLDFDATAHINHGPQEGRLFNAYYDHGVVRKQRCIN